jgi:hypothetical protein
MFVQQPAFPNTVPIDTKNTKKCMRKDDLTTTENNLSISEFSLQLSVQVSIADLVPETGIKKNPDPG